MAEKRPVRVNEDELEEGLHLTDLEMIKLTLLYEQRESEKLKLAIIAKSLDNCDLRIEKAEMEAKLGKFDRVPLTHAVKGATKKLEYHVTLYGSFRDELTKKYKLKKGWGFDTDTGEIDNLE